MDTNYTFLKFKNELDMGYQIYYTYMNKRYLVYKTTENCYTQELMTIEEKSPHPRLAMVTLKRIKELFPFMTEFEYKI